MATKTNSSQDEQKGNGSTQHEDRDDNIYVQEFIEYVKDVQK